MSTTNNTRQRGMNVYDDMIDDCEAVSAAIQFAAGEEVTELSHGLISSAIDGLLDSLEGITDSRPVPGTAFDITPRSMLPVRSMNATLIYDGSTLDTLADDRHFDADLPQNVRAASHLILEALHGRSFTAVHVPSTGGWRADGLAEMIRDAIAAALMHPEAQRP